MFQVSGTARFNLNLIRPVPVHSRPIRAAPSARPVHQRQRKSKAFSMLILTVRATLTEATSSSHADPFSRLAPTIDRACDTRYDTTSHLATVHRSRDIGSGLIDGHVVSDQRYTGRQCRHPPQHCHTTMFSPCRMTQRRRMVRPARHSH